MAFHVLIALACVVWLTSCGASLGALCLNLWAGSKRWRPALVLACVGLLIAYVGLTLIHIKASQTVNGHVQWSINSRWFFLGALGLGAISLALSIWNWRRASAQRKAALPIGERGVAPAVDPPVLDGTNRFTG